MITANLTVFMFYLTMLDSFSEYLSQMYVESSLDSLNHYKTIILQRVVRMFHTLKSLVNDGNDEVSARCVLRGILDSVTTYCFIYERPNMDEVLFRHYLYALDGFNSYKNSRVVFSNTHEIEPLLNSSIEHILFKLHNLPFYLQNRPIAERILNNKNWKFDSLEETKGLSFKEMYKRVGFQDDWATYYQEYLSQYAHGLCFSNRNHSSSEQVKHVLYESIPIANRLIRSINKTFPDSPIKMEECLPAIKKMVNSHEFNFEDCEVILSAMQEGNTTILI